MRSIHSISSDSDITSSRINLESNEQYKQKLKRYNIWIICSSDCRKVLSYQILEIQTGGARNPATNKLFECIYRTLCSIRFLIWVVFSRVIIQIEIRQKNDSKEFNCINEPQRVPLHLPKKILRLNHLWLITFLTSLLLKFMNSLSWFFGIALLRKWEYLSITKSSTFTENYLPPFPAHKCAKWQGQLISKIFWSSCVLRASWRKLLRYPIIEFVLSGKYVTKLSQSNENASLTSIHTS